MSRPVSSALILAIAAVSGCASDDDVGPGERLVGGWGLALDDDCHETLVLAMDRSYEQRLGCVTGEHDAEVEFYEGDWDASETDLFLFPRRGTCSRTDSSGFGDSRAELYSLSGDQLSLRITSGNRQLVFHRLEDDGAPSGSGTIHLGCYEGGAFAERAVADF